MLFHTRARPTAGVADQETDVPTSGLIGLVVGDLPTDKSTDLSTHGTGPALLKEGYQGILCTA